MVHPGHDVDPAQHLMGLYCLGLTASEIAAIVGRGKPWVLSRLRERAWRGRAVNLPCSRGAAATSWVR